MPLKETDPRLYEDLINRMKRIEGQARGIQRLLDEGADCDLITVQLSAMKAALNRVGVKLIACQLSEKMAGEIKDGGSGKEATAEMMETFLHLA